MSEVRSRRSEVGRLVSDLGLPTSDLLLILTGRENIYNKGVLLGFTKKEIDEKKDAIVEFGWVGERLLI